MRTGIPALVVLAAAVVPATTAVATAIRREPLATGDTVLAETFVPGEVDEYVFHAVRGSTPVIGFRPRPPGNWTPSIGIYEASYARSVPLAGISAASAKSAAPLPASAEYRIVVSSAGATAGAYEVSLRVDPGRAFSASGEGDATPAPLVFGAVPGSKVTVTLAWKGAAPVTLTSLDGPDGPLDAPPPPRVRGRRSVQAGFVTRTTGDHTATVAVPPGTVRWSVAVQVAPPRPVRNPVRDLTTVGPPSAADLELRNLPYAPGLVVRGERGGGNDVAFAPGATAPTAFISDPRAGGYAFQPIDRGDEPSGWDFRNGGGWYAQIRNVVREDGRIVAFDVPVIRSPAGTGRATFRDAVYDEAGRPVAWTETRNFDASGGVHTFRVADLVRGTGDVVLAYSVEHTPPDGAARTYDYAPIQAR